jgi:outer membrane PBP1 activator LpoA protein
MFRLPLLSVPVIISPGVPMKHIHAVVQQLKKEREHTQQQLQRIDEALAALGSVGSNGASRTLSAAARRKISVAQKARWAKVKGHAPKPKRTISLAGRRRIAAAQRARWAKVKKAA